MTRKPLKKPNSPESSISYGGTPDDAWSKVQDEAERRGQIRRRLIGRAECVLFKARVVVGIYGEWLRSDPFGLYGVERSTTTDSE